MKKLLFLIFLSLIIFHSPVSAQQKYVLPYPSIMPGSGWYKINKIFESVQGIWYFGSFGQFKYNLKLADKYLVEAKTLFEYNQYLLGNNSLKMSDKYFSTASTFLLKAASEGKDTREKTTLYQSAAARHKEVLSGLHNTVPDRFNWQAENDQPRLLLLHEDLQNSIAIRSKYE